MGSEAKLELSPISVVRSAARAFERDRYLSALLAPAAARDDLIALAAFAGELARIPATVSEPMIGEIRLQWWRDTLEAAGTDGAPAAGHPIADALARATRRYGIAAADLQALIDAQSARLDDLPFDDLPALQAHLSAWDGGLFTLAFRMLAGSADDAPARELLAAAGTAYGLSRCLIEAPAELAQGRIVLPHALLARHGLTVENARSPLATDGWRALFGEIAVHVEQQCQGITQRYQEADRKVRIAALPIALVRPYLRVSQGAEVSALAARDVGPLTRVWRLWLTSRTGRF